MCRSWSTDSLQKRAPRYDRRDISWRHAPVELAACESIVTVSNCERVGRFEPLNLCYSPHLTTRLAAWSHVESRSGPASCQPSGTGARRRFSPSLSKQSQPLLYSLATVTLRRNALLRRSGVRRRSAKPSKVSRAPAEAARRSTFLLSAAAGVTSHTSHRLPLESRKVR